MMLFVQTIGGLLGITVAALFLAETNPPWMVYAVIAGASGWGSAWLYARVRYGRGVTVSPSRPEDWRRD